MLVLPVGPYMPVGPVTPVKPVERRRTRERARPRPSVATSHPARPAREIASASARAALDDIKLGG